MVTIYYLLCGVFCLRLLWQVKRTYTATNKDTETAQVFSRSLLFQNREYLGGVMKFMAHNMKAANDVVMLLWMIMGLFSRYFNIFAPMFLMVISEGFALGFMPPKQAKHTLMALYLAESFLMGLAAYKFFYAC